MNGTVTITLKLFDELRNFQEAANVKNDNLQKAKQLKVRLLSWPANIVQKSIIATVCFANLKRFVHTTSQCEYVGSKSLNCGR